MKLRAIRRRHYGAYQFLDFRVTLGPDGDWQHPGLTIHALRRRFRKMFEVQPYQRVALDAIEQNVRGVGLESGAAVEKSFRQWPESGYIDPRKD